MWMPLTQSAGVHTLGADNWLVNPVADMEESEYSGYFSSIKISVSFSKEGK